MKPLADIRAPRTQADDAALLAAILYRRYLASIGVTDERKP